MTSEEGRRLPLSRSQLQCLLYLANGLPQDGATWRILADVTQIPELTVRTVCRAYFDSAGDPKTGPDLAKAMARDESLFCGRESEGVQIGFMEAGTMSLEVAARRLTIDGRPRPVLNGVK